jgi:putative SOS response-associated peptidase YedK
VGEARVDQCSKQKAISEHSLPGVSRKASLPCAGDWLDEWQDTGQKRTQPYYLHFDRVLAFAGVWTAHKVNDADSDANFAIITTHARGIAEQIHDRMPRVVHPQNYVAWIDPKSESPGCLLSPAQVNDRLRTPDFRLRRAAGSWVYVAVTAPSLSDLERNASDLLDRRGGLHHQYVRIAA